MLKVNQDSFKPSHEALGWLRSLQRLASLEVVGLLKLLMPPAQYISNFFIRKPKKEMKLRKIYQKENFQPQTRNLSSD